MKNLIIIIIISLIISNCSFNKVIKHHGVHSLEKKQSKLITKKSNKNDITAILGSPSTKGSFNTDIWIYIERKYTKKSIIKLGQKKLIVNNVLVLEIDNKGLLAKKDFFDMNNMKQVNFYSRSTETINKKNTFVYDFLSSVRQKISDPLGKRK
jgi:outer membrane protein assembly factor BamE (lipoprotein component of BamABCDE complex)